MLDALTRRLQAIDRIGMVINTSGERDRVEEALRQTLNYRAAATIVLSGTPPATLITTCVNSGQRVILINRDDHVAGPVHLSVDNGGAAARDALHMLPSVWLQPELCRRLLHRRDAQPRRPGAQLSGGRRRGRRALHGTSPGAGPPAMPRASRQAASAQRLQHGRMRRSV